MYTWPLTYVLRARQEKEKNHSCAWQAALEQKKKFSTLLHLCACVCVCVCLSKKIETHARTPICNLKKRAHMCAPGQTCQDVEHTRYLHRLIRKSRESTQLEKACIPIWSPFQRGIPPADRKAENIPRCSWQWLIRN